MGLNVKYLFSLQQDNLELAIYEIEQLLQCKLIHLFKEFYYTSEAISCELIKRLAYTNTAYEVIQELDKYDVETFKVSFKEDTEQITDKEKYYDIFDEATKDARVELTKPDIHFTVFNSQPILLTKVIFDNNKGYWDRTPGKRPAFHPTSMSPKIAKAMINIAGPKIKTVYDPFCGTGGVLIESLHNGLTAKGSDINDDMLTAAEMNLKDSVTKYNLEQNYELEKVSALQTTTTADVIISDVPYGKNTKSVGDIDTLYLDFLSHVYNKKLTDQIVLCIPDKSKLRENIDSHKWKMEKEISEYVHKSMTRFILRLTRV